MQFPRLTARRLWITGGVAVAMLAGAIVVVSVNEKAQRLARWLPHVSIDRKARRITLGINLAPPYEAQALPTLKPLVDDLKFLAPPPKLQP